MSDADGFGVWQSGEQKSMKRREKDQSTKRIGDYRLMWLGLLLLVALIFACVGFSYGRIRKGLENAADAAMVETANENAAMLQLTLESRFALMDNVGAKIAENPENAQDILTYLGEYANGYGFKRLCYMDSTGWTVTSDGKSGDFSFRSYFRRGMQGQYSITGEINDRLSSGEAVHVMSAPVRDAKTREVIGVVLADYTPEAFQKMMDVETFGGEGRGYIVETTGEIIAASTSAVIAATGNLPEEMTHLSAVSGEDAEQLRQILAGEQSGEGRVLGAGSLRFCCRPIENYCENDTWYLVMVANADTLYGRMNVVFSGIRTLLSVIVLLCAAFVFTMLMIYRRYNENLRHVAYTDALTGGSNFSGFLTKASSAEGGYMVSCDLDDYKMIAGMFGAQKGDDVLRGVYECIHGGLTANEPVARVDADHFVFYLGERQRAAVLERLRQIERGIRRLSDKMGVIHVVPRFGVYAMRPDEDVRRACELANLALGAARGNGDNTVAFYQDVDQNAFFENMQMEDRFDAAIVGHQFKAYYQPKCNPKTGEIVGGEALVRWVQEDGTMLPPARFIPLFEKNGAIGKLDEYMFTCVCAQMSQWRQEGIEIRPISVNLSRASLCRQGVALTYKRILEGYGLSTWMVPLEVTESAMVSDDAVISVLQEFYRYGFRIEIDDFGKEQSTLPMLKLPFVDTVKLDKSLIDCIGDRKGEIMLRQVVRLCYELGLYTTAEGVEAEDQVDFLRALDCTDIQGYFFSPPLPVEKYTEKLKRQTRKQA